MSIVAGACSSIVVALLFCHAELVKIRKELEKRNGDAS